ncbi:histone-fold-containing protein [Gamsiella multidivaricata]|uniref:histone-fold-containing protein n=1 Tax=Gamsiella multidivaricata TaxID=101098 RepID=UPI002220CACE|nr:histone-fold-containing protein [Gamsiella multidivaricata]KAG0370843.1 hypothetical protein BGZ54_003565 [Gamsiella multidivaricata]KAI7818687.1 histone-fold-containing protein [Gamsiella multidivaricata]
MAGPARVSSSLTSKPKAGSSGKVQKKTPAKSTTSKSSTGSGSSVYTGTAKGVTVLPVARVKRIIKEDKDVQMVSNDAVFVISLATEMFLESFTSKAFNLAKMEKRKTVSYKDLATAVTQHDSLEFLQDVVPKTTTLSDALEKRRIIKEKEESRAQGESDEDDVEENGNDEANEEEEEEEEDLDPLSESEDINSSRPLSDDEELSGPDEMDED